MKSEEGMKKMTIGERLKELRLFLGLTQEEMTQEVVSESFYSKVERGTSKINILDLLEILNKNGINLEDFFEEENSTNKNNLNNELIKSDEFKKIFGKLDLKLSQLTPEEAGKIIRLFIKLNREDEVKNHVSVIREVAKIMLNQLKEEYKGDLFSEARQLIELIEGLPPYPILAVDKLIAQYYSGLIEENLLKVKQIKELIKFNGYSYLLKDLPKISGKGGE